jgi:hypothetical protein
MTLDPINNVNLSDPQVLPQVSNHDWRDPPVFPVVIYPSDEHIFRIPFGEHHKVILINQSSFKIGACIGVDEGSAILIVGKEGGPIPFIGLDDKDQTIVIDDSFFRRFE